MMKMQHKGLLVVAVTMVLLTACRGGRRTADYERMVDSIRKAEVEKQLREQMGTDDPVAAFMDTLNMQSLPIKYSSEFVNYLPGFRKLPAMLYPIFNYADSMEVRIIGLPVSHHHAVVMLAEHPTPAETVLTLYTLSRDWQVVDQLCVYEVVNTDEKDSFGQSYLDFYITSKYEITLMRYYRAFDSEQTVLKEARGYFINKEGYFEERIIEMPGEDVK